MVSDIFFLEEKKKKCVNGVVKKNLVRVLYFSREVKNKPFLIHSKVLPLTIYRVFETYLTRFAKTN